MENEQRSVEVVQPEQHLNMTTLCTIDECRRREFEQLSPDEALKIFNDDGIRYGFY